MDHEFGSANCRRIRPGWDWFSLQLNDGRELMLYRLRQKDGSVTPQSSGSLIDARGAVTHLLLRDFFDRVDGSWKSPHTGRRIPAAGACACRARVSTSSLTPTVLDQELANATAASRIGKAPSTCATRRPAAPRRRLCRTHRLRRRDLPLGKRLAPTRSAARIDVCLSVTPSDVEGRGRVAQDRGDPSTTRLRRSARDDIVAPGITRVPLQFVCHPERRRGTATSRADRERVPRRRACGALLGMTSVAGITRVPLPSFVTPSDVEGQPQSRKIVAVPRRRACGAARDDIVAAG